MCIRDRVEPDFYNLGRVSGTDKSGNEGTEDVYKRQMESQSQLLTSSTAGRDWLILRQPAHMHSLVTA